MKILLAEDDTSISTIAKIALEKLGGHQVTVVADGNKAFATALEQEFDLILLDSMMPGRDGITVCKQLKASPKAHIPIIIVSAKSQESDIKEGLDSGATGYVQKPFDPKTLNQSLLDILQRAGKSA